MEVTKYFYKESDTEPSAYKIHNILDLFTCNIIHEYYKNVGVESEDPAMVNNISFENGAMTYGKVSDVLGISILNLITPIVSSILKKEVLPSYSFTRIYEKGTRLIPHRDREACEISMSITLVNAPNMLKEENFYISENEDETEALKMSLNTGDALMFFGSTHTGNGFYHWRDTTDSDYIAQIFLHWVYADGEFKDYAYEWTK